MDLTEKRVNSNYIFHGKIMTVRVDDALLPNGEPCIREVCEHPGGVGVLPIDENRMVTLVRQYRYPYAETTLEILTVYFPRSGKRGRSRPAGAV